MQPRLHCGAVVLPPRTPTSFRAAASPDPLPCSVSLQPRPQRERGAALLALGAAAGPPIGLLLGRLLGPGGGTAAVALAAGAGAVGWVMRYVEGVYDQGFWIVGGPRLPWTPPEVQSGLDLATFEGGPVRRHGGGGAGDGSVGVLGSERV